MSLLLGLQALRSEGDYSVMFCSIQSVAAVFLLQNAEEEIVINGCDLLRLLTDCRMNTTHSGQSGVRLLSAPLMDLSLTPDV